MTPSQAAAFIVANPHRKMQRPEMIMHGLAETFCIQFLAEVKILGDAPVPS
jgi:hypothetical protein